MGKIKKGVVFTLSLVFLLGWFSGNVLSGESGLERPSILGFFSGSAVEVSSPFDHINENQIHVLNDKVVIDLKNPQWASFTDTNSMDPVLDAEAHAIELIPKSPEEIHTGDIVSYVPGFGTGTIIHRVKKIGYDSDGWYAIMKGDNLSNEDPGKVRFDQVRRFVVAIIY